jgi:hypothetical protein
MRRTRNLTERLTFSFLCLNERNLTERLPFSFLCLNERLPVPSPSCETWCSMPVARGTTTIKATWRTGPRTAALCDALRDRECHQTKRPPSEPITGLLYYSQSQTRTLSLGLSHWRLRSPCLGHTQDSCGYCR